LDADNAPDLTDETEVPVAPGALRSGTAFGDYELIEEIAHGGMGVVFKARQRSLDRTVAVKMLLFGGFAERAAFQRFKAEAQNAARLQHPNIVAIHEIGEQDGQPFYSMDYVRGRNLAEVDRPLDARRAAGYLRDIARAVQYAHDQGLLHRDLKPANILIDENDRPRITDFGLARRIEDDTHLTLTGQVLGSPNFMPPEQARGGQSALGPASDIYSLGAVLYYLLTGRPPFAADTFEITLARVLNEEPLSARQLNPSVPRDLETICLRCLEKEPHRRFTSAHALAEELDRFLRGEPLESRPIGWMGRAWRWSRRKPALAAMAGALALALIGAGIIAGAGAVRIAQERETARIEAYYAAIGLADAQIKEGKR
jgi:serine/threonine-protein kinase